MKGTFIRYRDIDFKVDTLTIISTANKIIDEYEGAGYSLTLRQLYYQFVARGVIENSKASYDRLGNIVSDGRMAGLISWTAIEDRTRNLQGYETFDGPQDAMEAMIKDYKIDMWHNQDFRPEVWVEKDALVGVIGDICSKLRVNFFACKGYNSQSEQWRAGRRMAEYYRRGQRPIVFHLGDHDPSGLDMTRDNEERLSLFAGTQVQVVRLALNYPQIEEHNPPPNPVKFSDSRAGDYVERYGEHSWELDALDPKTIHRIIERAINQIRDEVKWNAALDEETTDIQRMEDMKETL